MLISETIFLGVGKLTYCKRKKNNNVEHMMNFSNNIPVRIHGNCISIYLNIWNAPDFVCDGR